MTETMTYTGTLTITRCWCGIHVAIPSDLYREARQAGTSVYCPVGHTFVYKNSTVERAEQRAKRAEAELEAARSLAQRERGRRVVAQRQASAARGQVTKIKNRVKNGVCPCCNRTFQDLGRHMKNQHPSFGAKQDA